MENQVLLRLIKTKQWECIVSNLFQSLVTGGPTALVWGFFISATASQAMAFSLAELARQVVFPRLRVALENNN